MLVLSLANAQPTIVMVVLIASTPQTECTMIELVIIPVGIVAVSEVDTVVGPDIGVIACRDAEVIVVAVGVATPDAHTPCVTYHIYRTIEIVAIHKPAVLAAAKHIHEILITHVEQVVVIVDGIVVSIYHIVYDLVHLVEEVEVDFIHVIVLAVRQSELVSHTVGEEAGFTTDVAQTHGCITLCTDSCQDYHHKGHSHLFHNLDRVSR